MQRPAVLLLVAALLASLGFNIFMVHCINRQNKIFANRFSFRNANSRDTFFDPQCQDVHEIAGRRLKSEFWICSLALMNTRTVYRKQGLFNRETDFIELAEHGYWMALTLKEIAPEGTLLWASTFPTGNKTAQMIEAIDGY